jgi:hypothetical protein
MVEYILCYCGPAEHWDPLPTTSKASRKILIGQNIKKRTGTALCVLCGLYHISWAMLYWNVQYTMHSLWWPMTDTLQWGMGGQCPLKSSYRSLCCINPNDDIKKNWLIYILQWALSMEGREKVIEYRDSLVRPQSTQSAGPIRFLIFCSISVILLAGRRPQCTHGAD